MSAGHWTNFCRNGHVAYTFGEYGQYGDNEPEICPECGSAELKGLNEWIDEQTDIVSEQPLRYEEKYQAIPDVYYKETSTQKEVMRKFVETVYQKVRVPIYDVSQLFEKKKKIKT